MAVFMSVLRRSVYGGERDCIESGPDLEEEWRRGGCAGGIAADAEPRGPEGWSSEHGEGG
jgi:hypothetical protein